MIHHLLERLENNKTPIICFAERLDYQDLDVITHFLTYDKTKTHLALTNACIDQRGAKLIAKMLAINSSLTHLDLSNNNVEFEGAIAIFEALQAHPNIISLNLENNEIIDTKYVSVEDNPRKELISNIHLYHLKMSGNFLGGEIMSALIYAIHKDQSLTFVTLNDVYLGLRSAQDLLKAVKENTQIFGLILNIHSFKLGFNKRYMQSNDMITDFSQIINEFQNNDNIALVGALDIPKIRRNQKIVAELTKLLIEFHTSSITNSSSATNPQFTSYDEMHKFLQDITKYEEAIKYFMSLDYIRKNSTQIHTRKSTVTKIVTIYQRLELIAQKEAEIFFDHAHDHLAVYLYNNFACENLDKNGMEEEYWDEIEEIWEEEMTSKKRLSSDIISGDISELKKAKFEEGNELSQGDEISKRSEIGEIVIDGEIGGIIEEVMSGRIEKIEVFDQEKRLWTEIDEKEKKCHERKELHQEKISEEKFLAQDELKKESTIATK